MRGTRIKQAALGGFCLLALAACSREEEFDITGPTHRINHFIAKESWHMKSQQTYQAFIEGELGRGFTEHDFVAYMENNGAECDRDPGNQVMYCRYITFGEMADPNSLWESMPVADLWCFWTYPNGTQQLSDFDQVGYARGRDSEKQTQKDYAHIYNIPPCKQLLRKVRGIEK